MGSSFAKSASADRGFDEQAPLSNTGSSYDFMQILVTNDDGVGSPGIEALEEALAELGEVLVVAPDSERSGASHSITVSHPLRAKRLRRRGRPEAYVVNGTPADCVKLAIKHILKRPPDLLASGINLGANVGIDVLYSGTVAAAVEGAIFGVPSLAVSLDTFDHVDFRPAAQFAKDVATSLLESPLPQGTLLNVNVPALPATAVKGVKITTQSKVGYRDEFIRRSDPKGRDYFWLTGGLPSDIMRDQDTDTATLKSGYVSVTPLQYDMTCYPAMERIAAWMPRTMRPPQED